jgi:oxygen-independent coproporphyrinogen-3 oxidase
LLSGLYVHLPFCRRRCSYCPFAISIDLRLRERYFDALAREISHWPCRDDEVTTLYFGGGTPSLSSVGELRRIVGLLPALGAETEFTFEANPEDLDAGAIEAWGELGVNRLSVGVQSLHEEELRPLGRLHGPARAIESLQLSLQAGLRTNADLIIGLPGQTRARFVESLEPVLATGVGHVSLYVLDLDEDTPLRRRIEKGRSVLPDEDVVVDLYMEAVERCAAHGLDQYETSNFARRGEESRHNIAYWTREPYRGVGLGAHSFDGRRRFANVRDIHDYIDRSERGESTTGFEEILSGIEAVEEEIFLSLRRSEGIEVARLVELRGDTVTEWIERALAAGAIALRGDRVAFTPRGFLLSSELIADLF